MEKFDNGALKPYLNEESAKDLAQALKIIINSIYGLTSATFDNEFRDKRNLDNIVVKGGNLFVFVLKDQVENMGYTVYHINTDSIKVTDADDRVKEDIMEKFDNIHHPSHYTEGRRFEPKDVIRDWGLNFNLGSAVKYIARAGRKDDILTDLSKAKEFIDFEIDAIKKERRDE